MKNTLDTDSLGHDVAYYLTTDDIRNLVLRIDNAKAAAIKHDRAVNLTLVDQKNFPSGRGDTAEKRAADINARCDAEETLLCAETTVRLAQIGYLEWNNKKYATPDAPGK